jgi:hypothetical protein
MEARPERFYLSQRKRPIESHGVTDKKSHSFCQPGKVVQEFVPRHSRNVADQPPERPEWQSFNTFDSKEADNGGCRNRRVNHNGIIRRNSWQPTAQLDALDTREYTVNKSRTN